ncbi:hypothetical protein RHS01_03006 [Rhizoctonia solani]|uniref:Uncharacterized protein n=1 Tax=Rhizoctonia solani TaxID=456999 RepID=A0A8H7M7G4_9AGAM|nr:hypothetical protein RHS01_03006 [Rhizoctonia solani]
MASAGRAHKRVGVARDRPSEEPPPVNSGPLRGLSSSSSSDDTHPRARVPSHPSIARSKHRRDKKRQDKTKRTHTTAWRTQHDQMRLDERCKTPKLTSRTHTQTQRDPRGRLPHSSGLSLVCARQRARSDEVREFEPG